MGKTEKDTDKEKDKAEEETEQEFPTIKPSFLPGQVVWLIDDDDVEEEFDCPACKAHGQIKLYDEEAYDCPKCRGKGQLKRKVVEFYVKTPAMIYEFEFSCSLREQKLKETYDIKVPDRLSEEDARFKTGEDLDWESTMYNRRNRVLPLLLAPTYDEAVERAKELTKTEREAKEREEAEKRKKQQEEAREKARKKELLSAMK